MGKEADALEALRATLGMPRLPNQLKIDPLQLTPERWSGSKDAIKPIEHPLDPAVAVEYRGTVPMPSQPFELWSGTSTWRSNYSPTGAVYGCQALADQRVRTTHPSDVTLCRYLRARDYDVEKAGEMYNASLEFRKEYNVDAILATPDANEQVWHTQTPHLHCGHDKLGRPIYIERSGQVRVGEMMSIVNREDFKCRHVRHIEQMEARIEDASQKRGRLVQQMVVIMDLKGLSFKPDSAAMNAFKDTMKMDQDHYPERLGDLFIINAPWVFSGLW